MPTPTAIVMCSLAFIVVPACRRGFGLWFAAAPTGTGGSDGDVAPLGGRESCGARLSAGAASLGVVGYPLGFIQGFLDLARRDLRDVHGAAHHAGGALLALRSCRHVASPVADLAIIYIVRGGVTRNGAGKFQTETLPEFIVRSTSEHPSDRLRSEACSAYTSREWRQSTPCGFPCCGTREVSHKGLISVNSFPDRLLD